jgi:hypothetical protein
MSVARGDGFIERIFGGSCLLVDGCYRPLWAEVKVAGDVETHNVDGC